MGKSALRIKMNLCFKRHKFILILKALFPITNKINILSYQAVSIVRVFHLKNVNINHKYSVLQVTSLRFIERLS